MAKNVDKWRKKVNKHITKVYFLWISAARAAAFGGYGVGVRPRTSRAAGLPLRVAKKEEVYTHGICISDVCSGRSQIYRLHE